MYKIVTILLLVISLNSMAQNADNNYRKPLKDVMGEVQTRFGVKISCPEELVKDKWVTYADWRFRPGDFEKTMNNILASLDLSYKQTGDKAYKLKEYTYYLKTPEEGLYQLNYLSALYNDVKSWEKRRAELKACMLSSLHLSPMPPKPSSKPILTNKRGYNGYTIENIAIETMPGVYVSGSLYAPAAIKGKIPVVLCPDGHFGNGRYRADCQYRCAMLAKMGCMAISYDLFAWGESALQFTEAAHRRSVAQIMQALNSMRILDYLLSLPYADALRVAITGASGGGSQTMTETAMDDRITLSVPVVMMSSYHSGGCPCESGIGIHLCDNGTNNVEIAAMAAPRPQLVISDGGDWTQNVPQNEFPFLQRTYSFYGKDAIVKNVHFSAEGHDYGLSKRKAMYDFVAQQFGLNTSTTKDKNGAWDESAVKIEAFPMMYVFGEKGERLPANAVKDVTVVEKMFGM